MADKGTELSIVIRTVDKATAGIRDVNKRLDELTRPTREFGKALAELGEKSGFNTVRDRFKEVGGAVKEVGFRVLEIGAVIGEATHLVFELVDSFARLGHTAQRAGVETDFLAGIRFAAEKTGVPIDQLDGGLITLTQNMGQARAGTGRMLKFLQQVSPVLAHQVTTAHSTAEAIGLLADATAKLPDPARRAALAQKTLGDSALAPLLAKGSAGIQDLLTAYAKLAPGQGEAAKNAIEVEDALVDLHAATDGVKAAIVTGLSPALRIVVDQLKEWLVAHRDDVAHWAQDIGERLPGAVDHVVTSVRGAVDQVSGFVEAIGGWKVAAGALAVVMAGPLIESVVALGAALLTTPVGVVIAGLAAIAAGITAITHETKEFKSFADSLADQKAHPPAGQSFEELQQEGLRNSRDRARQEAYAKATGTTLDDAAYDINTRDKADIDRVLKQYQFQEGITRGFGAAYDAAYEASGGSVPTGGDSQSGPLPPVPFRVGPPQEVNIKVDIAGAPRGTTAKVVTKGGANVDLTTGYQMGTP